MNLTELRKEIEDLQDGLDYQKKLHYETAYHRREEMRFQLKGIKQTVEAFKPFMFQALESGTMTTDDWDEWQKIKELLEVKD